MRLRWDNVKCLQSGPGGHAWSSLNHCLRHHLPHRLSVWLKADSLIIIGAHTWLETLCVSCGSQQCSWGSPGLGGPPSLDHAASTPLTPLSHCLPPQPHWVGSFQHGFSASGPLHSLFLLPRKLFLSLFMWLSHSHSEPPSVHTPWG